MHSENHDHQINYRQPKTVKTSLYYIPEEHCKKNKVINLTHNMLAKILVLKGKCRQATREIEPCYDN